MSPKRVGGMLVAIGVLHTLFALVRFGEPLGEIVADGIFGAGHGAERGQAFWFLIGGFAFLLLGELVARLERSGLSPGAAFGWGLLGVSVLGVVVYPVSGFWLLLVPAALAIRTSRGRPAPTA